VTCTFSLWRILASGLFAAVKRKSVLIQLLLLLLVIVALLLAFTAGLVLHN
jgi:hypothetical protein